MSAPYEIDINNFLGHDYNSFCKDMAYHALSNPKTYALMESTSSKAIRGDVVSNMFKHIFKILTTGKTEAGIVLFFDANKTAISPKYMNKEVNEFCVKVSNHIDEMLKELLDICFPKGIDSVLFDKLGNIGKKDL